MSDSWPKPPYTFVTSDNLAVKLRDGGQAGKEYAIIDVRDSDFVGGNITGAQNVPSMTFGDELPKLVKNLKDVPVVYFHCSLSQQRGPTAAVEYANAREKAFGTDDASKQQVQVLRGGFTRFQEQYRDDPKLIEKFDKRIWG